MRRRRCDSAGRCGPGDRFADRARPTDAAQLLPAAHPPLRSLRTLVFKVNTSAGDLRDDSTLPRGKDGPAERRHLFGNQTKRKRGSRLIDARSWRHRESKYRGVGASLRDRPDAGDGPARRGPGASRTTACRLTPSRPSVPHQRQCGDEIRRMTRGCFVESGHLASASAARMRRSISGADVSARMLDKIAAAGFSGLVCIELGQVMPEADQRALVSSGLDWLMRYLTDHDATGSASP